MKSVADAGVWRDIEAAIAGATGGPFQSARRSSVPGGCINSAWLLASGARRYFVKVNAAAAASMFAAEAEGLAALAGAGAIRVPHAICHGGNDDASWIVLEHIELHARTAATDAALGAQLAALHRHCASAYGWTRDNTIGATAQRNARSDDWSAFWRENRLGAQLERARINGYGGTLKARGEKLAERLHALFESYTPAAALLHGDLWSGNAQADETGAPVVFDPAVYYGDREADIAMTELFGGYSPSFYAGYAAAYPLDAGYRVRKDLYNLYHVLNHLNLFGGAYLQQSERLIDALLAHVS